MAAATQPGPAEPVSDVRPATELVRARPRGVSAVASPLEIPGPWRHRNVAANGARFHLAELGDGPLVLLLHGFPEFWWAWRYQLEALAAAGYRAVAMDLRGYGASDMTPRGYDPFTLAADVAGVVRALGEPRATVVGHGLGGFVGWSTAVLQRPFVERLAVVSALHPRHARSLGPSRLVGLAAAVELQLPWLPERRLIADEGAWVEELLARSSRDGWPDPATARRYREAMQLWPAPHCALEYPRWLVRSALRSDGRRFAARMREPVRVPVLHVHGKLDHAIRRSVAAEAAAYVRAPYRWVEMEAAGHFPHEEAPEEFTAELLAWLADTSA